MTPRAARLATLLILALGVRAASGQQPDPNRYPITVQQPTFRFGQNPVPGAAQAPMPGPMQPATAAPTESLRYPLPEPAGPPSPLVTAEPRTPNTEPQLPIPKGELFEPGRIIATVGDKFILYGDVSPIVNQLLQPMLDKATNPLEQHEIEKYREPLTRQTLNQMIETKLMYLEFERDLLKKAPKDKLAEVQANVTKKVSESFENDLREMRKKVADAKPDQIQELMRRDPNVTRLALLMRDNQVETLGELDLLLRRFGSTLEKQVRYYGEYKLGRTGIATHINFNPEVTHQEMLDYYYEHAADYAVPAKARFEILTAKSANFPNRGAAYSAIAAMGNEVFFGAPFKAVAQKSSQEPNAKQGGYYDWTSQGSLASEPINQALFTLEVGKLSQIIEDDQGYHIVRVIERTPAGQVSFLDAQKEIKKAIELRKRDGDYKKIVEKLSHGTQVWSIYDSSTATAPPQPGAPVPR
ncbi:MAG TPA: peptidyl-prolyl cis-trans isomerase [Pirellulaceae bacterium]|nr:peptidyl-prolyl cis-trans isomerase [Pirellulaceae bacterium]